MKKLKSLKFFFLVSFVIAFARIETLPILSISEEDYFQRSENDQSCLEINGERKLLEAYLNAEEIVFDVGAHEGEWSSVAFQINPNIHLLSFEPTPDIYNILSSRFDSLNILTYNLAVSSNDGKAFLHTHRDQHSQQNSLHLREINTPLRDGSLEINTISLDSFCINNNIPHIDFLKIDTEGNEYNVLLGANQLLEAQKIHAIQFEYGGTYPDAGITLKEVYFFLSEQGFLIFRILPEGLLPMKSWDDRYEDYCYRNFFAILPNMIPIIFESHAFNNL